MAVRPVAVMRRAGALFFGRRLQPVHAPALTLARTPLEELLLSDDVSPPDSAIRLHEGAPASADQAGRH